MTKKELIKLIPFGIGCILFLTYAIQVLLIPSHLNEEGNEVTYSMVDSVKYAGFGLAIVLTLIPVNKPVWKYVFAILTIMAFSEHINFYPYTFSFGIGIISFEVTALSLLIFHLVMNPEVFQFFKEFIKPKPESEESKQSKFESTVNGFETRFKNKSSTELETIVSENSLVPEAVEAAKRILKNK